MFFIDWLFKIIFFFLKVFVKFVNRYEEFRKEVFRGDEFLNFICFGFLGVFNLMNLFFI